MVLATSTGYEISSQVARELSELYRQAQGGHLAGRLWQEVLSEDERIMLGGKFVDAYKNEPHHMVGLYQRLYPRLSIERALLEVMREAGWLLEARYQRLVRGIGEPLELPPSRGARPLWDKKCRSLHLNGEAIRFIKQPRKAWRIVAVLDAFQAQGWPFHVGRKTIGLSAVRLSDSLRRLNAGLQRIVFEMDGSGTGVIWRLV